MNDLTYAAWTCGGLWLLAFFAAYVGYGAYLVWRCWQEQGAAK